MSLSRQQLALLGIFALFIGPVLLVILMRSSWWQYQPSALRNNGYLVQPPVPLPLTRTEELDGKWMILHVLEQPCDQVCIDRATMLRQTHLAAGRNGQHLAIVILVRTPVEPGLQSRLGSIYSQFNIISDTTPTAFQILSDIDQQASAVTPDSTSTHSYVLDPMNNVILAYSDSAEPGDMHKDLKRLLKWSDQESR